jgi:hypothetical protein
MNFPDMPDNHFGPFLAACGGIVDHLSRAIPMVPDPRKRESLARMLSGFKDGIEEFKDKAIPEFEKSHKELQASTEKTMDLLEDHKALRTRMEEIREDLAAKVEEAKAAKAEPKPERKPPARPSVAVKPRADAALLDGDILRGLLMSIRKPAEKPPSGIRTTGNIWENWKPGPGGAP